MTTPKVAVITLNWRNLQDTVECLDSLLRQDYPDFQIFVLDNGSGDGSAYCIEEWGRERLGDDFRSFWMDRGDLSLAHKVILVKSTKNLGFAGGNNLACQLAIKTDPDYIWFINNDTIQDTGALSALVRVAQSDKKTGMVCSKVLYLGRPDVIESTGSNLVLPFGVFRHINHGKKDSGLTTVPMEVSYIYGCSFLVNTRLIKDIGMMDERYFLLREESDWSLRAKRRGWKLYSASDSKVWHKVSTSVGKRSEMFFYYVTRNTLLFMRKHYPYLLPIAALSMLPLVSGLILFDSLFSEGKSLPGRLKMLARGYMHFLKGRFGELK